VDGELGKIFLVQNVEHCMDHFPKTKVLFGKNMNGIE
jgi:hypothetical protein